MDRLKNKTILIGREPSDGRLLIYIPEIKKYGAIGNPGCVPKSVSRCKVQEGVAHAKICVDQNGNLTLTKMKPDSKTYVNGIEIVSKRITESATVEFGKDHYGIDVPVVLESAKKLLPQPPEDPCDISHLKNVWNKYETEMDRIAISQQELAKKRQLPIIVSMSSGAITTILGLITTSTLWATIPVSVIVSCLYFINYRKKDTSYEDRKLAQNTLQHNYVCPSCNRLFPIISYDLLKNELISPKDQKMHCPKCGRELIEKK